MMQRWARMFESRISCAESSSSSFWERKMMDELQLLFFLLFSKQYQLRSTSRWKWTEIERDVDTESLKSQHLSKKTNVLRRILNYWRHPLSCNLSFLRDVLNAISPHIVPMYFSELHTKYDEDRCGGSLNKYFELIIWILEAAAFFHLFFAFGRGPGGAATSEHNKSHFTLKRLQTQSKTVAEIQKLQ